MSLRPYSREQKIQQIESLKKDAASKLYIKTNLLLIPGRPARDYCNQMIWRRWRVSASSGADMVRRTERVRTSSSTAGCMRGLLKMRRM